MSAGILSRTVKSVNEIGPHLKPQALNAMSRLSRPQEQLLIVRCHGKDATEAAWAWTSLLQKWGENTVVSPRK